MKIKLDFFSLSGLLILSLFLISDVMGKNSMQSDDFSSCNLLDGPQLEKLQSTVIHFHKLLNGLKVYILQTKRLPIVSIRLLVDVGAGDELPGEGGYAHLFEHMMFKGSKNVPDGGHFAAIKSMGGHINATTDYDKTVYWTDAPSEFLEQVLWLEAERLKNLTITESNLENQRQAVLEEKLLRIDNVPYYKVASEFMVSAWQGTDYDHLIIGSEEEIKLATVADVKKFFNEYYQFDNTILVLVGDIDPESSIAMINAIFTDSGFSQDQRIVKSRDVKAVLSGKTETRFDPLAPFPLYALGWHTVGKNNRDFYAVELLADILLNHDGSRLKKQLKEEQELVFETIGFPLTFEQAGITAMGMVPHSYVNFAQIKNLIRKELQQIRLQGVTEAELCSAKKHRQLLLLKKMNSNRSMAELIADGVLFFDDPWHFISAIKAYEKVENEQIRAVAREYFHEDWLALEIVPGPGVRLMKFLMEILPTNLSKTIEHEFL